jgi:NAD(P)-dependent dehydrogenase (short-subunit alcohol dehydrogenase family)
MINPMDLSGKIILVTGASSGIGRATAIQLSKLGGRIALVARDEEKLKKTIEMMEGEGHAVYSFDLSQIDNIEGLIKLIVQENGVLNGLVHCAGIAPLRPLGLTKGDFLHNVMLINFYSFVEMVRCISKKSNYAIGASLIGISSVASKMGDKSKVAYCSSKAALDVWQKNWRERVFALIR